MMRRVSAEVVIVGGTGARLGDPDKRYGAVRLSGETALTFSSMPGWLAARGCRHGSRDLLGRDAWHVACSCPRGRRASPVHFRRRLGDRYDVDDPLGPASGSRASIGVEGC